MAGVKRCTAIFTIGVVFIVCVNSQESRLDAGQFREAVNNVQKWLIGLHANKTHSSILKTDFDGDKSVNIEPVKPQDLVRKMAEDIHILLTTKRNALQKIVDHLEDATMSYLWDDYLTLNKSRPLLMKNLDPHNATHEMVYDEKLGVEVRYNQSGIHVPLEVYEGYPEILNGLKWSATVDQVFRENFERDPTLMWQYFGAQTGFMRVYPATRWKVPPNLIDLYDARIRPWYVQGSVPPKDMIILMDRSGSVHGQTFSIMKWAVKTLIDTLGENDFVNVAAFNDTTEWVNNCTYCKANETREENKDCCQPLVQASTRNKKLLYRAIDDLEDGGMASYSDALIFAYKAFKEFERTRKVGEGANCHKTIMLFSDGGTEWPEDVFKRYLADNDTKNVRVFTYAVGPHPIPTAVLKQMACSTGGQYSVITTSSSVRTKIQESYTSLQTPAQPQKGKHGEQYTTAYTSAVTEEMTISLTRPVYNMSDYANTSELLGVAGIDVPIQTLKNVSPFEALGPNGYAFIINHNGFLVMHPRLGRQLSYLLGPPHIDLLDVEEDVGEMEAIRNNMVRGSNGQKVMIGKIRIDDSHRVAYSGVQYDYSPIHNSSYSLGLLTLRRSQHLVIEDHEALWDEQPNVTCTVVAPWPYCRGREGITQDENLATLMDDIFQRKKSCNDKLVQGLVWSQRWTKPLMDKWMAERVSSEDIIGRAIFTRFGLTRFFPESQKSGATKWRDPLNNPALRRAELGGSVAVIPHNKGAFLSAPVLVNGEVVAAAVGVNLTSNYLRQGFKQSIPHFWKNEDILWILVDDGGLIVTSNREDFYGSKLQGLFLGDLNMPLMKHLKEAGVFNMDHEVDTQALCVDKHDWNSAGPRIPNPLTLLANSLLEIFSWAEYFRYIIYSGILALLSPRVESFSEWGMTRIGDKESCIMEKTIYYFGETNTYTDFMKCRNYTAEFRATRLESINALLVVIDMSEGSPECGVHSNLPSIMPQRVTTVDPCSYQDRFRERPPTCLIGNSTAGKLGCSGCPRQLQSSLTLMLIALGMCRMFLHMGHEH